MASGSQISLDQRLVFDYESRKIKIRANNDRWLHGDLGSKVGELRADRRPSMSELTSTDCSFYWTKAELRVTLDPELSDGPVSVYQMQWTSTNENDSWLIDTFDLGEFHWYGGAATANQRWPLEANHPVPLSPFLTSDVFKGQFGNVQARYWLCSGHVAVTVDADVSLWVGVNEGDDNRLKLGASNSGVYRNGRSPTASESLRLRYQIWVVDDPRPLRDLHLTVVRNRLGKPSCVPDRRLLQQPVWSTWARYKTEIDQGSVMAYAEEIVRHGFERGLLVVDDGWAAEHGDLRWNRAKFPDPRAMTERLTADGFRLGLWIHPFFNLTSEAAGDSANRPYFVADPRDSDRPATVDWWNGRGHVLDPSTDAARRWFAQRLEDFRREFNLESFKFDAGEVNWLPSEARLDLNAYSARCVECTRGLVHETRLGAETQRLSVCLTRVMDKSSNWTYQNGLRSVLPSVLLQGLLGYPFVLPDMIGGNDQLPEPELFVRWAQLNALLPAVQFSFRPWDYAESAAIDRACSATRQALAIRRRLMPRLLAAAQRAVDTGRPMVTPIWWNDESQSALSCDDQFLLDDGLMVAPVVERGVSHRRVYLPEPDARWRLFDDESSDWHRGGGWISQPVDPDRLLVYVRSN